MQSIALDWDGPFSLRPDAPNSLFSAAAGLQPGLYVWTVSTAAGQLIQYVGETGKTFGSRHREHLRSYEKGMYTVHRASSFRLGRRDPLYRGYLWSKKRRATQLPDFLARQAELAPELSDLLGAVQLFVAPLHLDLRMRRRIEAALVNQLLAASGQEAAFLDEGLSKWVRLPAEEPIAVVSRGKHRLRGVPARFEA